MTWRMADLPSVGCNLLFKVMTVIGDDLCGIKSAYGFSSVCDVGVTRRLIVTYIVTLPIFKNTELTSHWILVS